MTKADQGPHRLQSRLEAVIRNIIAGEGPIGMDRYMSLALSHPQHGYYMNKDPLGVKGDFITAPEISQTFGELLGIWCAAGWHFMGAPAEWQLVELGPGRGTLMNDVFRTSSVMPGMTTGMELHLVETSPALRTAQRMTLQNLDVRIAWHDSLDTVPMAPSIFLANEFLDALPIMQLQRSCGKWHERVVGLSAAGKLEIGMAAQPVPAAMVPDWASGAVDGEIAEISPARTAVATEIGGRLAAHPGAALFIDYGHGEPAPGDTLQAVAKHKFVDVLYRPGEADITSHVDFRSIFSSLEASGSKPYGPIEQGAFLVRMGIREREGVLRSRARANQRIRISQAVTRLVSDTGMGKLFKVLAATSPGLPAPVPFRGGLS